MHRLLTVLAIAFFSAVPLAAQQPTPPMVTPRPVQQGQTPRPGQGAPMPPQPPARPGAPGPAMTTPAVQAPASQGPSSWQNIKLDVSITDSLSVEAQAKKTVTMLVLDGRSGQIRSTGNGMVNIDATPMIRPDGRIYIHLTIQYLPDLTAQQSQQSQQAGNARLGLLDESLSLIVADGKPILAAQSADPRGDRKVSVEITATVQK